MEAIWLKSADVAALLQYLYDECPFFYRRPAYSALGLELDTRCRTCYRQF